MKDNDNFGTILTFVVLIGLIGIFGFSFAGGPQNPETTVALRKLLEAKDCAVRAYVVKE